MPDIINITINTGHTLTYAAPPPRRVAGGTQVAFTNNSGEKVTLVAIDHERQKSYKIFDEGEGALIDVGVSGPHRRTIVADLPDRRFDLYVLCGGGLEPPIHGVKP